MKHSEVKEKPVGYGIAGFGRFALNRIVPAFQQLTGSKIVALQKRNSDEAAASAKEHGIPRGYGSFEEMLEDPQVEAVYLTSANFLHEEQAIAAALMGKHLLCEKPMAPNAEACHKIIDACKQACVKLMVAHNLRFSEPVKRIKNWIEEGMLGDIVSARMEFTFLGSQSPRSWILDPDVAGGGALMDLGVHCIDTFRFLLGEIEEIQAFIKSSSISPGIETAASLNMKFQSGAIGTVFCSYEAPYWNCLEISGSHGRAYTELFTVADSETSLRLRTSQSDEVFNLNVGNTHGGLITTFSQSLRHDTPIPIPGEEGLRNQKIIDRAYRQGTHLTI